jgi:NifU-like protein
MWEYSDKVKEHFFNPRNAGAVEEANATGEVGSISCGDALRLTLKVDPQTDTIVEAGFQTFGCGSAIASSSALTEMVKGMTLEQALTISNQDIADYLDGLPAEKMHCSVMGREALAAAIADYRGEQWHDDHEEGALICKCFGIDEAMIEQTVRANNLRSIEDVTHYTKAGGGCATCHEGIENVLTRIWGAVPAPAPVLSAAEVVPCGGLTNLQRIRRIEQVLESLRPMLQRDHGDVELVDVDGNVIYVNLVGACTGCMMAGATLGGIQQQLIEALGEFVRVVPASEMKRVAAGGR